MLATDYGKQNSSNTHWRRQMQRHSRIITIGCLAAAIMALSATTAAALPEVLPVENPNMTGESSGAVSIETVKLETIRCAAATGEGVQETDSSGTFHNHFTGCESAGFKCNTTGDAAGVVLVLGKLNLVFDGLAPLTVAVLLSPEEVTIHCSAFVTLKFRGNELCRGLEPLTVARTHSDHCVQSKGKSTDTTYYNDEGGAMTALLLVDKNGGPFEECAELALSSATSAEPKSAMNF